MMTKTLLTSLLLLLSLSSEATTLPEVIEKQCLGEINVNISGVTVPCFYKDHVVVFDLSKRWAEVMAKAIELGEKTQKRGAVVLIGTQQDEGYKKAHKLIYGLPIPIELNSLTLKRGI